MPHCLMIPRTLTCGHLPDKFDEQMSGLELVQALHLERSALVHKRQHLVGILDNLQQERKR